jgi:hypothetical protein
VSVLKAVGKGIAYLLFHLYLVIPLGYAFLLWLVGLFFGVRASEIGVLYLVGVILCLLLAVALILRRATAKKDAPARIKSRKPDKSQYTAGATVSRVPEEKPRKQKEKKDNPFYTVTEEQKSEAPGNPFVAKPYVPDPAAAPPQPQGYIPPQAPQPPDPVQPRLMRTRDDPDMYLAEYATYIDFYYRNRSTGAIEYAYRKYKAVV